MSEARARPGTGCPRGQDVVAERRAEGAAYMRSPAADALQQRLAQAEGAKAVVVRPRAWVGACHLVARYAAATVSSRAPTAVLKETAQQDPCLIRTSPR